MQLSKPKVILKINHYWYILLVSISYSSSIRVSLFGKSFDTLYYVLCIERNNVKTPNFYVCDIYVDIYILL